MLKCKLVWRISKRKSGTIKFGLNQFGLSNFSNIGFVMCTNCSSWSCPSFSILIFLRTWTKRFMESGGTRLLLWQGWLYTIIATGRQWSFPSSGSTNRDGCRQQERLSNLFGCSALFHNTAMFVGQNFTGNTNIGTWKRRNGALESLFSDYIFILDLFDADCPTRSQSGEFALFTTVDNPREELVAHKQFRINMFQAAMWQSLLASWTPGLLDKVGLWRSLSPQRVICAAFGLI